MKHEHLHGLTFQSATDSSYEYDDTVLTVTKLLWGDSMHFHRILGNLNFEYAYLQDYTNVMEMDDNVLR